MSTISRKKLLNSRNLLGFPSLIDQEGDIPNENPDVPKLLKIAQRVPCFHLVVPWSKEELSSLKDGVWSFTKILHTQRIIEQYTSGGQTELSQKEMEKMKQELHDLADFVRRGSRNAKKEFSNALDVIGNTMSHHTIDWDAIAKAFVPSRSGLDCQIRWLGNDDPRVNFGEWKTEETRDLLELVKEHGGRNWSVIAKELNTGRTAMQCFQRYQSTHNPRMIKREFTPEEDAKILELVERYGSNWDEISTHIPGRTASQLNHRYNNTSRQCIRSGNWTEEEDIKLILAHEAYTKWTEISSLLPGRTGMKCRERYMNVLDPNANQTKHCPWTKDETDRLFQLVSLYGAGNWSKIAEGMVTRTDNQCYRRWRNVAAKRTPKEYETYRKKIQVKKKAVLNNFVGRKRNRPNEISLVDLSGIVESDQEIEDDEMQSFTTDQFPKIAKISDCCP